MKRYLVIIAILLSACSLNPNRNFTTPLPAELGAARSLFHTYLIRKGPSPGRYDRNPPPKGVTQIAYPSGVLQLSAWLSDDPGDGTKHPALVYAHGGFSRDSEDWADLKPFIAAGFVVMFPAWRGENGNPGSFELFYGEVDDAIAAGRYLAQVPYVDRERIFICGHSNGGTLALLAAMMDSPYKRASAIGAAPDPRLIFRIYKQIVPFDTEDSREITLRSPVSHIRSLKIPVLLFAGNADPNASASGAFAEMAEQQSRSASYSLLLGNHFSSLRPAIDKTIEAFQTAP